jgi:hypothetical protein
VSLGELDDEGDDDREDDGQPGERRCVDVDHAEALVAAVAAQPEARFRGRRRSTARRTP